jgi:hypothetical protein
MFAEHALIEFDDGDPRVLQKPAEGRTPQGGRIISVSITIRILNLHVEVFAEGQA